MIISVGNSNNMYGIFTINSHCHYPSTYDFSGFFRTQEEIKEYWNELINKAHYYYFRPELVFRFTNGSHGYKSIIFETEYDLLKHTNVAIVDNRVAVPLNELFINPGEESKISYEHMGLIFDPYIHELTQKMEF